MTGQEQLEMLRRAAADLRNIARERPQHLRAKLIELAKGFEEEAEKLEWRLKAD